MVSFGLHPKQAICVNAKSPGGLSTGTRLPRESNPLNTCMCSSTCLAPQRGGAALIMMFRLLGRADNTSHTGPECEVDVIGDRNATLRPSVACDT
eukprot:1992989-Amphidinium_carterae.1